MLGSLRNLAYQALTYRKVQSKEIMATQCIYYKFILLSLLHLYILFRIF